MFSPFRRDLFGRAGYVLAALAMGLCGMVGFIPMDGIAGEPAPEEEPRWGIGPLGVRNVAPGHLLRPNVVMGGAPVWLTPGQWAARGSITIGNLWLYEKDRYLVDGEWVWLDVSATYAVTDRVQVAAGFPVIGRSGGFGDHAIEQFHRLLGLGNAGREKHPRNRLRVEWAGVNDPAVLDSQSWGVGDPFLGLTWRIPDRPGSRTGTFFLAGCSFPLGDADNLEGLGVPLAYLSVLVNGGRSASPWGWFVGTGFSYARVDNWRGIPLRRGEWSGLLGTQFSLSPQTSLVAQYVIVSPVTHGAHGFSKPTHEIHLGLRRRITRNLFLVAAMTENLFIFNNSTDVGLHMALTGMF